MKALKRELQSVVKALKLLTQKTEKIAKKLDKLEAPKTVKKQQKRVKTKTVKRAVTRKPKKVTAGEALMRIIKASRKGVSAAVLKNKTGFNDQKIRDNIYRLKKQGKIKAVSRGFYVKA